MRLPCHHAQADSQILTAGVTRRGIADAFALLHQLADKTPGVRTAVLGNVIADVDKVSPGLRRKSDWNHQTVRLPLGLVVARFGSA